MAVLTQIQLEGSSTVYDINDARISATSVATATHFLATNSGVSAINPISAADLASVLGGEHILNRTYNANYYHCRLGTASSTSGALKILGLNTASCEDVIYLLFDKSVRYTKIFGYQHPIKEVYYVIPQSGDYVDIYFKHNSFTLTVYAIGSAEYVESVSTIPAGAIAATEDS